MACTVNAQDVGALFTAMPDELQFPNSHLLPERIWWNSSKAAKATAQNTMNGDVKLGSDRQLPQLQVVK